MTFIIIGTCNSCHGKVTVPEFWASTIPPIPSCRSCGKRMKTQYPICEMEKE